MNEPSNLEGTIREIVRQEVKAVLAEVVPSGEAPTAEPRWMTPPQASRKTGVPAKAIRNMIKERAIEVRLRNISRNPAQPKYLVNVDQVATAAARWHEVKKGISNATSLTVQELARRILSDRDSREQRRDSEVATPASAASGSRTSK